MYNIVINDMGFYKWFGSAHAPCDRAFCSSNQHWESLDCIM